MTLLEANLVYNQSPSFTANTIVKAICFKLIWNVKKNFQFLSLLTNNFYLLSVKSKTLRRGTLISRSQNSPPAILKLNDV